MDKSLITIVTVIALTLAPHFVRGEQSIVCSEHQALFCDDFENGLNPLWTQEGPPVWLVTGGVATAVLTGSQVHSYLLIEDTSWTDYTVEFDVIGNSGVEKTVGFRHISSRPGYGFSIRSDWNGDEAILHRIGDGILQVVTFPSQNGVWYHVVITCVGNHIIASVNGTRVIDYEDVDNSCPSGGIFLSCNTGDAGVCGLSFDNVIVTDKASPSAGLLAYWNFNETAGDTVFDVSGNVKHAVLVNGPQRVTGRSGNAVYFDGVDDYAPFAPLYPVSPQALTVSLWILPGNAPRGTAIYHGRYGEWGVGSDGVICWTGLKPACCDWLGVTSPFNSDSSWHHLVMTWIQGDAVRLYLDGMERGRTTVPDSPLLDPAWSDFRPALGAYIEFPYVRDFYRGAIDEVKVFDLSLSPIEIWNLFGGVDFTSGDADGSGAVTISDAVFLINYIFASGPAPSPLLAGDADCGGVITISDAIFLINYIFAGGEPPCAG